MPFTTESAYHAMAHTGMALFVDVYSEIYAENPDQKTPFEPLELKRMMWDRMLATVSNVKTNSVRVPFENIKLTKIQFPFLPEQIKYTGCIAIKKNGDLYTPCCAKLKDDETLCAGCAKKHTYGLLQDREKNIAEGMFKPKTYGEWLKKEGKTPEQVYAAMHEQGFSFIIPMEHFEEGEVRTRRKGRPAKEDKKSKNEVHVTDLESESESEEELPPIKPAAKKAEKAESSTPSLPVLTEPKARKPTEPLLKVKTPSDEEEKPKKSRAKKPKEEEDEEEEEEKPKKAKAKQEKPKEEEEKPKKAKKEEPKKAKKPKAKVEASDDEELGNLGEELEEEVYSTEIHGITYNVNKKNIILSADNRPLGKLDDDGDAEWFGDER